MSSFSAVDRVTTDELKRFTTIDLIFEGLCSIAIDVLGYGQPRRFGEVEMATACVHTIVDNLVASSMVPQVLLDLPIHSQKRERARQSRDRVFNDDIYCPQHTMCVGCGYNDEK